MAFSIALYNVVMHGICFMLVFTAFQTSSNVQTSVLNSIVRDGKHPFKGKGYVSLAIIYAVFSLANFIAPPIVSLIGPRLSLILGGLCYCLFIGSLIYPFVSTLYIASVIIGLGAAVIWTAQGNFLTINSNQDTMGRNSGIFWALLQCSLLFGNMFVYFYFKGTIDISLTEARTVFIVLGVCCLAGTFCFLLLRKPPHEHTEDIPEETSRTPGIYQSVSTEDEELTVNMNKKKLEQFGSSPPPSPYEAFKKSFQLLTNHDMMLLSVTIAYTGNTGLLADNKREIGLVGMLIGIGEITGGLAFGIFGKRVNKYGRDPIILFGYIVHMVTFFLIFINIPDKAPMGSTLEDTFIHNNVYVIGLSAFLLGLGDSSFNTQLYSILGSLFSEDSSSAFALFKCVQSVAAAIGFAYANSTPLKWQLLVLVITAFFGTISFFSVEKKYRQQHREGYASID
eukprot:gene9173-10146_t